MEPRTSIEVGVATIATSSIAGFMHELYPFITFIAVLCGAILGCHGVFCLVRNWWKGNNNPPHWPNNF